MTISRIHSDKDVMNFYRLGDFQKSITSSAKISKSKSPHLKIPKSKSPHLKIPKSESPHVFRVPHFLSLISPHYKPHENYYRQISNIRRTKSQALHVSRLVLQLTLPNPLKPGIKSRMKM